MEYQSEIIDLDAVVSVNDENQIVILHSTFRVDEFIQELGSRFYCDEDTTVEKWIRKGAECKILTPGKPWRKGKIRVCLEFIPDELESSLDDVRKMISKNE